MHHTPHTTYRQATLLLCTLLLTLVFSGCGRRPADTPNLLIITIDTTRADHLGCYGYTNALTPNLNGLADAGVVFDDAQSCVPITLPSHCTIFTGLTPPEHSVRVNGDSKLPATIPTLAEILTTAGYNTGAVVASPVLLRHYGLDRGFSHYDDTMPDSTTPQLDHDAQHQPYRPAAEIATQALSWLKQAITQKRPWFLWTHFYDPHMPYADHSPILGNRFADSPYDAEITYMDFHIGLILDFLGQHNLKENTIVVAVADHGEGLGDNGENSHCFFIYRATQHVPLIITRKGHFKPGLRIPATISLADLTPTLLELLPTPRRPYPRGDSRNHTVTALRQRSFAPALNGAPLASRSCYIETVWPWFMFRWAPLYGLITEKHKYIRAPQPELYDRLTDPAETNNLATLDPRLTDDLALDLEAIEAAFTSVDRTAATISREELRALQSLGYTGGGGNTLSNVPNATIGLTDPKDVKPVITLQGKVRSLLGSSPAADNTLQGALQLIEIAPKTALFHTWIGAAYDARQDPTNALAHFTTALNLAPDSIPAHNAIAIFHAKRGQIGPAILHFEKAHLANPEDPSLRTNLAKALETLGIHLAKTGDNENAYECFIRIAYLLPDQPSSHLHLGHTLAGLHKTAEASAAYRKALTIDPAYTPALQALHSLTGNTNAVRHAAPHP